MLFEGERYVTDNKTLMQLCIENGIDISKLSNISFISETVSNYKSELDKFPSYDASNVPTLDYANEIVKKYLYKQEKYKVSALLLYNLTLARMEYNYDLDALYNEIAANIRNDIEVIKGELLNSLYTDGLEESKLYEMAKHGNIDSKVLKDIDDICANTETTVDTDNDSISEYKKLSEKSKSLFKKYFKKYYGLGHAIEMSLFVRYSSENKSNMYAIDNINKYKNVLDQVGDRYYLVQLETFYVRIGQTLSKTLKMLNMTVDDLVVTEKTYEERNAHINKILNQLYKRQCATNTISHLESEAYMRQMYDIVTKINGHGMILTMLDDMNIWILVPKRIDKDEAYKIIMETVANTFVSRALYRVHMCMDGTRRKQFIPYNDENTIIIYTEESRHV